MDPFVAEIRIFPFNFAPRGWAICNGQILPISQNTALFSLLGTTYGGDGKSTFALPNFQGAAPIHQGQGPGLSLFDLGQTGGSDTVSLLAIEMPNHAHVINGKNATGNTNLPTGNMLSNTPNTNPMYVTGSFPNVIMGFGVSTAGGDFPHNNMQPYLTLNFCIALQGVFPPRS